MKDFTLTYDLRHSRLLDESAEMSESLTALASPK